jgi:hypothetical protein
VGGAANYFATLLYARLYRILGELPKVFRMQIAGLAASIFITLTDGTRTLIAWKLIVPQITLGEIWAITFGFSFLAINILGTIIVSGLGSLLTVTERSRAVGRL